ncbi:hypothetical protein Bca52824_087397 [Brassica carinata]|uniref:Uncharacterized protein n=1 Tax=Brassica carinata TaxID=52824 RepID=A0A8X7TN76_BRACI|nr:hypothetical protein Bca52824_087397 [Brassica carinata]
MTKEEADLFIPALPSLVSLNFSKPELLLLLHQLVLSNPSGLSLISNLLCLCGVTFGSKYAMGSLDEDDQIASEICGQVQDVTQDVEYLKIGWEKMTAEYQGSQSRFTTIEERSGDKINLTSSREICSSRHGSSPKESLEPLGKQCITNK